MNSMLAAIRDAMTAPEAEGSPAALPPADASVSPQALAAAAGVSAAPIAPAAHVVPSAAAPLFNAAGPITLETAIAAAEARGREAGAKAERERIAAAVGASGVKGDAGRMSAALDLAAKAPAMSGEDIAAFVGGNVGTSAKADPAASYEASRIAAAGLAQPNKPAATGAADKVAGIMGNYRAVTGQPTR